MLDELIFGDVGWFGVDLHVESYDVDVASGTMTPQAGRANDDVTALALAPDGVGYGAYYDRLLVWTGHGVFAELFDHGIDAWIADETTLYGVGRAVDSVATIGSTHWNSGVSVSTWQRVEHGLIRTSLAVPLGRPGYGAPKPLGLALVPEAQTGWLMLAGLGCVARWNLRRRPGPERGEGTPR